MDDVEKVLRFHWRRTFVDIDKTSLLDVVVEDEDEAKKIRV